jgi:prolyl oligopeptidase
MFNGRRLESLSSLVFLFWSGILKDMNTHALCAALLLAGAAPALAQIPANPPVAPVRPVTDTYFGTTITDPYRWMENLADPEVKSWFQGQADHARAVLNTIPGRDALAAQIKALDGAGTSVGEVQVAGPRVFYTKERPQDNTPKLYVRDSLHGPERLLFDPEALGKDGAHYALDYYTPSLEGRYVAYGVSRGGSEQSVLHILDIDTGKEIAETIDRTRFGGVSWFPGGKAFVYDRQQTLTPGMSPMEDERKIKVFYHALGTDPSADKPLLGYGLSPRVPMTPDEYASLSIPPDSPYAVATVIHGVAPEVTVYVAPTDSLVKSEVPWRKVADVADAITGVATHGDSLFLLSHKNALRYKVLRVSLSHPEIANAEVVVPEGEAVVTAVGPASDALYVQKLDGGINRLFRLPYTSTGKVQEIALPYKGAVDGLVTDYGRPGALFLETAWTHSALWYEYDPKALTVADTRLKPLNPVDMSGYTSVEVKAKSADGTLIPLSIITKKGLTLDGSHPALLDGYGAYGEVSSPYFDPTRIPWLERGGVLATAHVRGGGEYGEGWHLAGKLATKPHTWEDFIACGQYLIDHGYTSPTHLAGEGTSAGGITIGRAITARPDLFGAALIRVGSVNALRAELSPNGPPNVPEFGTFTTLDGFQALYAMDAYQHVQDGVKYPAVMVETGINDPRVASWEPAKMAARLQAATGSGKPVILRVDYDAGHGMGSTKSQGDALRADEYAFLLWQLGDPSFQPSAPISAPQAPGSATKAPETKPNVLGTVKAIDPITVTGE